MANNKVVLSDGTTLIDLTRDTVTAASLYAGKTAHGNNGEPIVGEAVGYEHDTGSVAFDLESDVFASPLKGDLTNAFVLPDSTLDFVPRMMVLYPYNSAAAKQATPKNTDVRCVFFTMMQFDETGEPLPAGSYTMYSQLTAGTEAIAMVNNNLGFYYVDGHLVFAYRTASTVTTNASLKAARWCWRAWG